MNRFIFQAIAAPIDNDVFVADDAIEILPPIVQEGLHTLVEFILPPTYVSSDWPFSAGINVDDWPSSSMFYFEAELDTDDPLAPASARLWNITDGVVVPGSTITCWTAHADPVDPNTLVRSTQLSISGNKRYRAERGGPAGSGATIHLHSARVIAIY